MTLRTYRYTSHIPNTQREPSSSTLYFWTEVTKKTGRGTRCLERALVYIEIVEDENQIDCDRMRVGALYHCDHGGWKDV